MCQIYSESVAQGRATWKEDVAKTCMEPLEKGVGECDMSALYNPQSDDCHMHGDIMQGKVANNKECFIAEECSDVNAVCEPKTSEDPNKPLITAEGTCKALPGNGEQCSNQTCAMDCYCDSGDNTCKTKLADGATCTSYQMCKSDDCNNGTCRARNQNATYELCDGNPFSLFGITFALPISQP
jgi:hypothetical protein